MYIIGKIDREIYKCVTDNIATDDVIITDERIRHIEERHPGDYEKIFPYLLETLQEPDYIIRDRFPYTAIVLKHVVDSMTGKAIRISLRLVTSSDNKGYKNSVLTAMVVRKREFERLVRNKEILYKKE